MKKHLPLSALLVCTTLCLLLSGCGGGGDNTPVSRLTYNTADSISPLSGPATGGTSVLITGSYFSTRQSVSVKIGDVPLTDVVVRDDHTITGITGDARTSSLATGNPTEAFGDVVITTDGYTNQQHGVPKFLYIFAIK